MLPERIKIKVVELQDGEPKEVEKEYFYSFGFNSITKFRKAENLTVSKTAELFVELLKPVKERDVDKVAEANENFGKLFYYAIEEGMRVVKVKNDLSIDDVQAFLNNPSNIGATNKIASVYADSSVQGEEGGEEKKNQLP